MQTNKIGNVHSGAFV